LVYGHPTNTSEQIRVDTPGTVNIPVGWVLLYAEFKADATCKRSFPLPTIMPLGYDTPCILEFQKYVGGKWVKIASKMMMVQCSGALAYTQSYAEIHHEFQPTDLMSEVKKPGLEQFRFVVYDERISGGLFDPAKIVWYSWGGQKFLNVNGISEDTPPVQGDKRCYHMGVKQWFDSGDTICEGGFIKVCNNGSFTSTTTPCGQTPGPSPGNGGGTGLPFDLNNITQEQWMVIGGILLLVVLMKGKRR